MSIKVKDFITRIRLDIGDIDKDRFEDAHIVDLLNEAYCEIFEVRPDLFQKNVVAELSEGEVQQPCCCDKLYKVDAITDVNGIKIADIRKVDGGASTAMSRTRCKPSTDYPSEYSIETNSNNRFAVSPAVLPAKKVYARMLCAVKPKSIAFDVEQTLDQVGCDFYSAMIDYTLFRLYGTEQESVTSSNKSTQHYNWFYQRLGLHDKVKKTYQKEAK